MIEAIFPDIESGPYVDKILFKSIKLEDDDIGRKKAIGSISLGNRVILRWDIKSVRRLLFTNMVTAIIIANILGNISKDKCQPSCPPSRKVS